MEINVNLASLLWTLSSIIGLYNSLRIVPEYIITYRAAERVPAPDTEDARDTWGNFLWSEVLRLSLHIPSTVVGIMSFFIPTSQANVHRGHFETFFGLLVLIVLVWANVATTINTVIARRAYTRRRNPHRLWLPIRLLRRRK